MTRRFWAVRFAAVLATAACNDNARDNADEAGDARSEAADEMAEGDTASAREEMRDAAKYDSAAARDSAQGDNTEGLNRRPAPRDDASAPGRARRRFAAVTSGSCRRRAPGRSPPS